MKNFIIMIIIHLTLIVIYFNFGNCKVFCLVYHLFVYCYVKNQVIQVLANLCAVIINLYLSPTNLNYCSRFIHFSFKNDYFVIVFL